MTTLEIAAGGGALVGLWVLLLIASWLEDLVFPDEHRGSTSVPVWNGPAERVSWQPRAKASAATSAATQASPAVASEATVAAPVAIEAA